jgi:hypothetical protein
VQLAPGHHKQLIFRVMVVPHEFTLHLYQLYLKVIQLAHNLWIEIVLKGGKLLGQIDYLHGSTPSSLTNTKGRQHFTFVGLLQPAE